MTPRQREIVASIATFKVAYGYPPTVRELASICSMSVSTMHHHLDNLERQGRITRAPNKPRTVQVVPQEDNGDETAS